MGTDVTLVKEFSVDKTWFLYRDPRPTPTRVATGSMTVHDRWFYGPDEQLEIRFEATPARGWAVWFADERADFVAEIEPEPQLGDSIRTAKAKAVEVWTTRRRNVTENG